MNLKSFLPSFPRLLPTSLGESRTAPLARILCAAGLAAAPLALQPASAVASPPIDTHIDALEFQRAENGAGELLLSLSGPAPQAEAARDGDWIRIRFPAATAEEDVLRRYDVTDFATPVAAVELAADGPGLRLAIQVAGPFTYRAEYLDEHDGAPHDGALHNSDLHDGTIHDGTQHDNAGQSSPRYRVIVRPPAAENAAATEARADSADGGGERLSLNLQDIEVRAALQLIADFTDINIVASDSVSGRITLRLQDVPWERALELVLEAHGLDQRRAGNVLMVAPAAELAERERQSLEAERQAAELAPLQTDFIRIRYAKAADAVGLFKAGSEAGGTLLSPRGAVVVDERTNSLIVTDTAPRLREIRRLLRRVDIPIRQVMIEARIVIAQSDASRQLGIRWGGSKVDIDGINDAIFDPGVSDPSAIFTDRNSVYTGGLLVDLGVSGAAGSFAVGYASSNLLLAAELEALEAQGSGEVISQPKVITGDKQKASIKSGTEVPYQESSRSGETTVAFKEAVLRLDVTPNITPDDRILLDLVINQDSVGELVPSGTGGSIPTIDTTELSTQVLVGNGATVVLGGVFRTEEVESVTQVPLFGDIPFIGRLFKHTHTRSAKTETLIFITPRILEDE